MEPGNFSPRFDGDILVVTCARCDREVSRQDIFGVMDDIASQRGYRCPDCDASAPSDIAVPLVLDTCQRCRMKELTPVGMGKLRTIGPVEMFICDRCFGEVFGGRA
jgi:DNA-directed RNA polymerase subunit RPC12/RpoP